MKEKNQNILSIINKNFFNPNRRQKKKSKFYNIAKKEI